MVLDIPQDVRRNDGCLLSDALEVGAVTCSKIYLHRSVHERIFRFGPSRVFDASEDMAKVTFDALGLCMMGYRWV